MPRARGFQGSTDPQIHRLIRVPDERIHFVGAFQIALQVLIAIASLLLILTVLMHKGKGGGISDMFGGGLSSTAGSSGVAEKNLNRITYAVLAVWLVCIIAYALLLKLG